MLFLYGSNGMPEGVAAPFLIGAVCCLTLFWHSGERLWIAAAGVALALGVASEYPAVPYGVAVFVALVGGVLWASEARVSAPQGRGRAIEGLGLLLARPADLRRAPVARGQCRDHGRSRSTSCSGTTDTGPSSAPRTPTAAVAYVTGDVVGALVLVGERVFPFLIPLAFVLLVRLVDGRLWRVNTLSVDAARPQRAAGHGRPVGHHRLADGLPAVSRVPAVRRGGLGAVRDRDQPAAPRCRRADPRWLAGRVPGRALDHVRSQARAGGAPRAEGRRAGARPRRLGAAPLPPASSSRSACGPRSRSTWRRTSCPRAATSSSTRSRGDR